MKNTESDIIQLINFDTQQNVKVSVVIPIYNVEKYLKECVQSAMDQTLPDIEIICVNDGSTDSSLSILKALAKQDKRIRIIDKKNAGYGRAVNVGMAHAKGEYIAILESDDLIHKTMYAKLYDLAKKTDADIVKGNYYKFWGDFSHDPKLVFCKLNSLSKCYKTVINPATCLDIFQFNTTWSGIYKKSFLEKHNIKHQETPGASYQDIGFWFLTTCCATKIYYTEDAFYYYRQDNINSSINNKGKVYFASEEYRHIYEFLKSDPTLYSNFIGIYYVRKYYNYNYTLNRIAPSFREEFIKFFADEFNASFAKKEINEKLFPAGDLARLKAICANPLEVLKSDNPITIVFGSDSNYLPYVSVAIQSIKENANKNDYYEIHIFYEEIDQTKINKMLMMQTDHFCIVFNNVSERLKSNCYYKTGHFTRAMYYRWLIPEILKDREKVLYLDCDLMLLRDCAELYNMDIGDKVVGAIHNVCNNVTKKYVETKLNLPIDQYFNSGVLLMNCAKFQMLDIRTKCAEILSKKPDLLFPDQDSLNLVLFGQVCFLSGKWNCQWNHLFSKNTIYALSDEEEHIFNESLIDTGIIHFASPIKPWNKPEARFADIFWKHAKNTPFYEDICQANPSYKVSVILPIYNMEKYLGECLDTVFAQTLANVEVICVNDGSTDGTKRILESYKKKHDNMVIINTPNKGVGSARNTGIMNAHGEFIAFMDPDDWYPNHSVLEKLYTKAKKNNVLICGGSFLMQQGDEIISTFEGLNRDNVFYKEGLISYYDYQFDYSFHRFIYNRKFLLDNKLFFPNYSRYQDPQFFVRAMTLAKKFYAIVDITYKYRCGQKAINWTFKKVNDMMLALNDILLWSKVHKLAKLHYLTYNRINYEYQPVISASICKGNLVAFGIATKINGNVDYNLLRQYDSSIPNKQLINPLFQIYNEYILNSSSTKNSGSIQEIISLSTQLSDIKKSWSFRVGRLITYFPRKIRDFFRKKKHK